MGDIKEAFERVKLDMYYLNENLISLSREVSDLREQLNKIELQPKSSQKIESAEPKKGVEKERLPTAFNFNFKNYSPEKYVLNFVLDNKTDISTGNEGVKTNSTDIQTDNLVFKPLNDQIYAISTGNEGVKTDRQTHRQTDIFQLKSSDNQKESFREEVLNSQATKENSLMETEEILNSLDSLKKDLRLKFKRLTDQELLVFSTIYQLEEQFGYSDYKMLSKKLKLTESSIRDYVKRLLSKRIPLEKKKVNNKEINLFVSPNLKKILPLDSLLRLVNL